MLPQNQIETMKQLAQTVSYFHTLEKNKEHKQLSDLNIYIV